MDGIKKQIIFDNYEIDDQVRFYKKEEKEIELTLPGKLLLKGDINIKFMNQTIFS
jgi:hypothetical protein